MMSNVCGMSTIVWLPFHVQPRAGPMAARLRAPTRSQRRSVWAKSVGQFCHGGDGPARRLQRGVRQPPVNRRLDDVPWAKATPEQDDDSDVTITEQQNMYDA